MKMIMKKLILTKGYIKVMYGLLIYRRIFLDRDVLPSKEREKTAVWMKYCVHMVLS